MHIVLASSSSGSRGGGEIYLTYLGEALSNRGHDVTLWVSDAEKMDDLAASFESIGTVVRAPYTNTYDHSTRVLATAFNTSLSRSIARQWEDLGADVVHVNKQNLEDGLDLLRAGRYADVSSVCTIHITQSARYLDAQFAGLRDWTSRRELQRFGGPFITVQEQRKEDLLRFLGGRGDVVAINNGVPLYDVPFPENVRAQKRDALGISEDALLFLAVGRLEKQKRPLFFLEQAARLHEALPHARFAWVGDGRLANEWETQRRALGLEDVVQCAGWQDDVEPFYAAADMFLHVAAFEGLPLALIEAMSARLPCVIPTSLLNDFRAISDSHVLCLEESSLTETLQSAHERDAVAERGRTLVEECLSVGTMAQQYEYVYRSAIQSSSS